MYDYWGIKCWKQTEWYKIIQYIFINRINLSMRIYPSIWIHSMHILPSTMQTASGFSGKSVYCIKNMQHLNHLKQNTKIKLEKRRKKTTNIIAVPDGWHPLDSDRLQACNILWTYFSCHYVIMRCNVTYTMMEYIPHMATHGIIQDKRMRHTLHVPGGDRCCSYVQSDN